MVTEMRIFLIPLAGLERPREPYLLNLGYRRLLYDCIGTQEP